MAGELTHKDSMGKKETLAQGALQFMSAGTGVRHSEANSHRKLPLRVVQSWVLPRSSGLAPAYGSVPAAAAPARQDVWAHLVSDVKNKATATPVKINQDANLFVARVSPGTTLTLPVKAGRQAYVVVLEGGATLTAGGVKAVCAPGDAADVIGETQLAATATAAAAHILVWEMANPLSDG